MSVPKKAFWTIAMDILAELKEQYGLAYAGVPVDPFEARHISKHVDGFVILKNAGDSFHEPLVTATMGTFKVEGQIRQGDMALIYSLTPEFTYQDYVRFANEFYQRLNQILSTIINTNAVSHNYVLTENPFPKVFELKSTRNRPLPENAWLGTVRAKRNGQGEF